MSDRTTERAYRIQDNLEIPYVRARPMAEKIEQAAQTQVVWPENREPMVPVNEQDLLLVGILGSAWVIQIHDRDGIPFRVLTCSFSVASTDSGIRSLTVIVAYEPGSTSYADREVLAMTVWDGDELTHKEFIPAHGHPQAVADLINKALAEQNLNRQIHPLTSSMISDWPKE